MEMEEHAKVVNIASVRKAVSLLAKFKVSFIVVELIQYFRKDLVLGCSKKGRLQESQVFTTSSMFAYFEKLNSPTRAITKTETYTVGKMNFSSCCCCSQYLAQNWSKWS